MERHAPGVIVRSWMPDQRGGKKEVNTIIRFYLDGSDKPAMRGICWIFSMARR